MDPDEEEAEDPEGDPACTEAGAPAPEQPQSPAEAEVVEGVAEEGAPGEASASHVAEVAPVAVAGSHSGVAPISRRPARDICGISDPTVEQLAQLCGALSEADGLATTADASVGASGPRPRVRHVGGRRGLHLCLPDGQVADKGTPFPPSPLPPPPSSHGILPSHPSLSVANACIGM